MRGVLEDCFEISGRGVVAALASETEARVSIGDRLVIGGRMWRVTGVEMTNYFGRSPPKDVRSKLGVMLEGATKADLSPLVGQRFEIETSRTT